MLCCLQACFLFTALIAGKEERRKKKLNRSVTCRPAVVMRKCRM